MIAATSANLSEFSSSSGFKYFFKHGINLVTPHTTLLTTGNWNAKLFAFLDVPMVSLEVMILMWQTKKRKLYGIQRWVLKSQTLPSISNNNIINGYTCRQDMLENLIANTNPKSSSLSSISMHLSFNFQSSNRVTLDFPLARDRLQHAERVIQF